jgi:hypothetical protein
MMYHHSLAAQQILQRALGMANRQHSDEQIVKNAGLNRTKSVVQRFRTADLQGHLVETDNLMLGYRVAEMLWNYLDKMGFIKEAFHAAPTSDFSWTDRFVATALNAFYRVDESETVSWHEHRGFKGKYFCYKPSFRSPNHILKTRMEIQLANGECFKITEQQATKNDPTKASTEQSAGFGFSKSERLWFFLKEQSHDQPHDQPRIFCFDKIDTSFGKVTRLWGHVLESDKRYGGSVYKFNVSLIAREIDEALWKDVYPNKPYNEEEQIDNIPFDEAAARQNAGSRVIFDLELLKYIQPDIMKQRR